MILCVSVLAASCSWLDNPSPKGQIPANKLTDNDLALLTNGTLHQYEAFLSNLWFEGDYLAENFKGGPGFSYADVHGETQSASAQIPLTRWQYCYQKLNYANLLIKSALAASNQDNEKDCTRNRIPLQGNDLHRPCAALWRSAYHKSIRKH